MINALTAGEISESLRRIASAFCASMLKAMCQSGLRRNNSGALLVTDWISTRVLSGATAKVVWPGVWPLASLAVMPGATSSPHLYVVTLSLSSSISSQWN